MLHSFRGFGPWTNQTHVTAQHIPELRHFRDTELLQDDFEARQFLAVAIGIQTVHPEVLAKLPAAEFPNKRPALPGKQPNRTKRHKRDRDEQQEKTKDHVEAALDSAVCEF